MLKKTFNSIFNSIFLRIIHSKKLFLKNYSFKEKFIQKNWQLFIQKIIHLEKNGNYSFKKLFNYKKIIQQNIHSKNLKIIHSKKLFIFLKNWLSPRARFKTWHNFFAINNFCLESWNSLLESTLAMAVVLTCRSQTRCIFVILQIATIMDGEQAYIASGVLTWIQCKSGKQYLWNKLLVSALPVATKHPELSRDLSWKEYS